jgi:hypothetical protein
MQLPTARNFVFDNRISKKVASPLWPLSQA